MHTVRKIAAAALALGTAGLMVACGDAEVSEPVTMTITETSGSESAESADASGEESSEPEASEADPVETASSSSGGIELGADGRPTEAGLRAMMQQYRIGEVPTLKSFTWAAGSDLVGILKTADDNIYCDLYDWDTGLECVAVNWNHDKPYGRKELWENGVFSINTVKLHQDSVELHASNQGNFSHMAHHGHDQYDSLPLTLRPGDAVSYDGYVCVYEEHGLACWYQGTETGFHMSRTGAIFVE